MKKLREPLQAQGKLLAIIAGASIFVGVLLLVQLGSLTHGVSARELSFMERYGSLSEIAHNPLNLPLTLTAWLVQLLPMHGVFWLRLPEALFAAVTMLGMIYILRRWYGPRTAFFGFFLFATSAWVLHVGRLATADVLLLWGVVALLSSHILLSHHPNRSSAAWLWCVAQITLLYVPGMVWLVLLNIILQRSDISAAITSLKWVGKTVSAITVLALLTPLGMGFVSGSATELGLSLLGLPQYMPSLGTLWHNLAHSLLFVAVRGNAPNDVWLNHLPLLDAFLLTALLAGILFYAQHVRASRTRLILGFFIIGLALATVNGVMMLSLIVPLLYLVAAAGIAYLLHLWLSVFPRNPVARGTGIGLIALAIVISSVYGLRQYFIAWPHHTPTHAAFQKLPANKL